MSAFAREFVQDGELKRVSCEALDGGRYAVQVGGVRHEVAAAALPDGRVRFMLGERTFVAAAAPAGHALQVRFAGHTWTLEPARGGGAATGGAAATGVIEAPMTGTVLDVLVAEGDRVESGDPVVLLSAMKMEHKLTAGIAGTVAEVSAEVGATVDQGTLLVRIE